ncbi:TPA: hypothetical protein H1012_01730 [archaeon]|nr:hypothetical protein [Candidatus Naiadarchaeales archaeon SRR2090153.bin461]HIK02546.1 hypothetical protein [Candidatus Naiadarchaeales archaeon SRR2090159.bin1288]
MATKSKEIILLTSLFLALFAVAVFAASSQRSPATCSGQWTSCTNAFADNVNYASVTATSSVNRSGVWHNYSFSIPGSASIDSVVVRADAWSTNSRGRFNVRVSSDGGLTWGPDHTFGGNTAQQTFNIDVTSDRSWTPAILNSNNSSFKVNATCFKVGGGSNPTCRLDWIPVTVNYTQFDFSVSVSPSSGSVVAGNSITTTTTVTLLGGVSQPVSLSSTGCPAFATCTFNPTSGNPTYSSNFTVSTSASTPAGTYPINVTGTGDGKVRSAIYTLTVNSSCIRANPTVVVTPATQSGTAGSTLNYTTNVTNQDSAGCGSSTFNLSSNIPFGWTGFFQNNSLVISPGSFKTTVFSLTSTANATAGNYTFSNNATNAGAPSFKGSGIAIYRIV